MSFKLLIFVLKLKKMKTISKALLSAIILASCTNNKVISPSEGIPPTNPNICQPIKIDYDIRIKHVDSSKVTNLINGLGYTYKLNGNWVQVNKFNSPSNPIPVVSGVFFRGQFFIPCGLSDVNFQSNAFLLSSVAGDPANNPNNIATIQVWANNQLIVDKRQNGVDSLAWSYYKYDLSALVPVSY